jgi:hypothetical protein
MMLVDVDAPVPVCVDAPFKFHILLIVSHAQRLHLYRVQSDSDENRHHEKDDVFKH